MPDYTYTNGQGLAQLDATTPNGAIEEVNILDDAIRQIKAFLKDPTPGAALTPFVKFSTVDCDFCVITNSTQTVAITGSAIALTNLGTKSFDQGTNCNASGVFTVPVDGIYDFNYFMQVDDDGSTGVTMQILFGLLKNGGPNFELISGINNLGPSAASVLNRWFVQGACRLKVTKNDTLQLAISLTDGIQTANVNCANGWFSGHLEREL